MKMGRNVDWAFGKPIAIVRSRGAILGSAGWGWMGVKGGCYHPLVWFPNPLAAGSDFFKVRWVPCLTPAASWAEEAEVDATAAHCLLEG